MRKANMTLYYSDISNETLTASVKVISRKADLPAEVLAIDLSLNKQVKTISSSISNWLRFLNLRVVGNVNIVITSVNNLNYISTLPKLRKSQFEDHALSEIKESFKDIDYFYKQEIIDRGDLGTFVYTHLINNEIFGYMSEIVKTLKLKSALCPVSTYDLMFSAAKNNGLTEGLTFYFSNGEFYLALVVNGTWIDSMNIKDVLNTTKIINRINLFLIRHRTTLNLSLDSSIVFLSKNSKNEELIEALKERFNVKDVIYLEDKLEYSAVGNYKQYKKIRPWEKRMGLL